MLYIVFYFFTVDYKYNFTYCVGMTFSQLGSLSLVIGRNLCFVGGPFEEEETCKDVLGIYVLKQFIFFAMFFSIAYFHINIDKNRNSNISFKLKYIWYRLITKLDIIDYLCRELFYDFIIKEYDEELFNTFIKDNRLICDDNFNYQFIGNYSKFVNKDDVYDNKIANVENNVNNVNENNLNNVKK